MARPVLGTDPFAAVPASGVGDAAAPASTAAAPEAGGNGGAQTEPAPRPVRKRTPRRRPRATPPAAEDVDAKLAALESRLEDRLESRFGALEAKLDAALTQLTDAPRAAVREVGAGEDEDSEEEAFVGFLGDAPRGDETSDSDSTSSLDGGRARDRIEPSFVRGLLNLITPQGLGRRLGDLGLRGISDEVDEFGMDPVYVERATQFFDWMYQKYWRVDTEGLEHVPDDGRGLIVGNHSGTLPFDGVMIATAVRLHHAAGREVRALAEDMFATLPFIAPLLARVGGVRACPENAERLLKRDELVVVFPEGVKGTGKYYRQRYTLQRFGRGGFIKLCLRTGAPLIPVAVVGSEEIYPIMAKADWIGKPLGLPYTPITPTFPWLGPLGLIPLPTKWRIRFGEPLSFDQYGPDALEDDILINHLKESVRSRIQGMINEMLQERNSVWFG